MQEQQIDQTKVKIEQTRRQALEVGEWIARRLLENNELFSTLPPVLYTYYQIWLDMCQKEYHSDLYEKHFRKRLED